MRVLMVGWEYPPKNSGGLGVACQGIVENLVDLGVEVLLLLPVKEGGNTEVQLRQTPHGNPYGVMAIKSSIVPYPDSTKEGYRGDVVEDVKTYAWKISKLSFQDNFDVIHIHDWLTVPAGILLRNKFHKPLVMHVHSTEYDRTAGGDANEAVGKIELEGLREADRLIAVSGYTKSILVDRYGVEERKVDIVHNGSSPVKIPQTKPDFMGKVPVVIFVGRLTIQKGAEFFLKMAGLVLLKYPETVFVVAGDGDMYSDLVEYSASSNLTGSVLFSGFLRDMSREQLYQRADVFVMPSVSEPFGLVALEASLYGIPAVISKSSGVLEVLPSALVVDYWDTELIANLVSELISNDEKRFQLGKKVQKEAQLVTWNRAALEIKDIYQTLNK